MKKNAASIPHSIWPAGDLKRREQEAADSLGITLYELMLRAGQAAFQLARDNFPNTKHWLVLCGLEQRTARQRYGADYARQPARCAAYFS